MIIKTWRRKISSILGLLLLFGTFQGTSIFSADGVPASINKKIVVRDSHGNLYAGAQIQLTYDDQSGSGLAYQSYSEIATTNAQGEAVLNAPDTVSWLNLIVEPPATDLSQALFAKSLNLDDETINISLKASTLRMNILKSDGTNAKPHAWIYASNKIGMQAIRTGAFGLALTPQDIASGGYINIGPAEDESRDQGWVTYIAKNVSSGDSSSYKLFKYDGTAITPDGSNVFAAKFDQSNISGNLINTDGTPFVLPEGVSATIHFWRLNSEGKRWYEAGSTVMRSGDNSWNLQLWANAKTNGKHQVSVTFENSLTLGEVDAGNLWSNAEGKFSATETGTYVPTLNLSLKVSPTTPTFGFVVKDSTGALINATYYLYKPDSEFQIYPLNPGSKGNITLPSGKFVLEIYPANGSKQVYSTFTVINDHSTVSITDEFGNASVATNQVFDLVLKPVNFKFIISDPSTSVGLRLAPNISLRQYKSDVKGTTWYWVNAPWIKIDSQTIGMSLPEGTFKLDLNSSNSDSYGAKTYDVVRAGSTITVNALAPTEAGSIFKLPLNIANFKFKVVDPSDLSTALINSWVDVCSTDKSAYLNGAYGCLSSGVDLDALGGMYVAPGSYQIYVSGGEINVTKVYEATVDNAGAVTVVGVSASGGRFTLSPSKPNLTGSLFNSDETTPLSFTETQTAVVEVEYTDLNGNTYRTQGVGLGSWNQKFGFNLTDPGKYRLSATPNGFSEYANTYSQYIYVNNSGQISTSLSSGYGSEISDFKISLKSGNLPLTIKNPIDGEPIKSGYVYIYSYLNRNWSYFDLSVAIDGKVNANLEANTEGSIRIEPSGNPALNYKDYTVSVNESGTPTIRDGSAIIEKTESRYVLTSDRSNIYGQIVTPTGGQISNIKLQVMLQRSVKDKVGSSVADRWYNYAGSSADRDGNFGMSIREPGNYRILARPYGNVELSNGVSDSFTILSESATSFTKDLGRIKLTTPAIKVKTRISGSADFSTSYGITITQNGNWIGNPWVNSDGIAGINLPDAGIYELWIDPADDAGRTVTGKIYRLNVVSNSESTTATIDAGSGVSTAGGFTILEFGSPNLSGEVRTPDSSTALSNINVMAVDATTYKEFGQNAVNTDVSGKWSMNLGKGTYKIYARAPWGSIDYTNSDYVGDVVVDETGTVTSMPTGISASNMVMRLSTPTWSGVIRSPDSSTVVPYASICLSGYSTIYKGNYGWCTNSNDQGRWALTLPSTVTLNSDSQLWADDWNQRIYSQLRVRGKTAIEALIGTSGTNKTLNFPAPNIQISVTGGSNPSIGSWVNIDKPTGEWLGNAVTNSLGVASIYTDNLSGPFTVHVDVPQRNDVIPSYVSTTKTFTSVQVDSQTSAGKFSANVALKQPNLRGIVRDPNTHAAVINTWVDIRNESDNEWVSGASLTSSGTFGLYLKGSCCSATTKEYTITVNAPWDGTSKSVRKQYKALVDSSDVVTLYDKRTNAVISTESLSGTNVFSMTLQEPNFRAIVRKPSTGGTPGDVASWTYGQYGSVSWGYADFWNISTGEWVGNQRIESDGTISMYLPGGCECTKTSKEYRMTLRPAWESTGTFVPKDYKIVVDYNDAPTTTESRSGTAVGTETLSGGTYQSLSYGAPNVSGAVVNMYETGTAYSWVTFSPKNINWEEAKAKGYSGCGQECYFYSGIDGKFATNIQDGNYDVTANQKWWGTFEGAQSATCSLTIETGTITSGNYCLQEDGKIKLKLRAPNLTLTLNDGTAPVQNAWVSIGIGNYWTGARSDENGYVGIFIDTQTVSTNNSGQTGSRKIRVYVDPPWGSSTMARWNCESGDSKPICSALGDYTLGSAFTQSDLGTITPAKPNTTITVTKPDSSKSGWYNYVNVIRTFNSDGSRTYEWIGWNATNADGVVALNIETTTATANSKYFVHIEPNWSLRNEFTPKDYDNGGAGYTWAQINNATFALGTPNLQITSLLPDAATPNKWGWAGIETVNDSLTVTSWLTSAGVNEYGKASFTLPSSSKFKLTLNPGPGRYGTSTSCYLQSDSSGNVTPIDEQCSSGVISGGAAMSFTLARGNIVGKIKAADGTGIAGAVIYANLVDAPDESTSVVSCSTSTGDYGLILKPGLNYNIKVFPVNKSGVTYLDSLTNPITVPVSGSSTLNISLGT